MDAKIINKVSKHDTFYPYKHLFEGQEVIAFRNEMDVFISIEFVDEKHNHLVYSYYPHLNGHKSFILINHDDLFK